MNPQETSALTRFIEKIRTELKLTILLIEHDMRVVMGISDRITVLDYGRVLVTGTPEEIRSSAIVREIYFGEVAE